MHFDKQFFKKTGYKVTDDPIQPEPRPKALLAYFERFNEEARNPRPGTVAAIRKAISEFPDHPTLYNNLYMALEQSNQPAEARTVLREILERFPDYPFGKIMLAHQRLEDKDLPGARRALGTTGDIREFLPDTESFHYSLFNAYHAVAGRIEALLGNIKEAKDHLRLLLQLDPESVHAKTLGLIVFQEGPIKNMAEQKKASDALPHIEVKVPEKYTQTTDEPTLHHPEVGELIILPYDSMPERVQHQLLALPRETLVADLCTLLTDSISRFDYYESTEEDEAGNPPHHALALLAFLKAGEALPVVLDTLRQADSYSDFWFGDTPDLSYNWYLISIAEQRLPALQAFARERNISWLNKNHVNRAVAQMGLHWPETRPKAIAWYADLFRYLLDNEADKDLIDAQFISFAISESTDLRAAELLPLIREIDAKGWIDEQVMGKLPEIEEEIYLAPDPWDKAPLPLDLNDFYQEEYLKRREESNRPPLEMPFDEDDPVEQHMLRLIGKMLFAKKGYDDEYEDDDEDDYEDHWLPPVKPVETIRRAEPKVGRNDPCPCGSGKKYKRCHGKDA